MAAFFIQVPFARELVQWSNNTKCWGITHALGLHILAHEGGKNHQHRHPQLRSCNMWLSRFRTSSGSTCVDSAV
jgi:hypothetical protein